MEKPARFCRRDMYMHFFYELKESSMEIEKKTSVHVPPHLHRSLECIFVTSGTLELGIGTELFHMNTGDFGIVFPEQIHHYQVFDSAFCQAVYLLAAPSLSGPFSDHLQNFVPEYPVLSAADVHPDITYALQSLLNLGTPAWTSVLCQSYTQIILSRTLPLFSLQPKKDLTGQDIVFDAVSYMAGHFTEELSLSRMTKDLGYSQFALSRVFSSVFHTNFNQYLNDLRLNCALGLLKNTSLPVTELAMNAGFTSLRTFNRAFKERFHMSPREYRKQQAAPGS